jgi:hypothetical protein
MADAVRVGAIYYLFTIMDEMVSPASDYFAMCMVFYILISWLELDREKEKGFYPYAMLAVLTVYAVTIKLSASPLVLLTIKPVWKIIRSRQKKRYRIIIYYIGLGLLVSVPFFIRNVIISGWLVYPFTAVDLFDVIWKIPEGTALYDAHEIAVYGRGYTDVALYDMPLTGWFPHWWQTLGSFNKVMLAADLCCMVALIIFGAAYLVMKKRNQRKKRELQAGKTTNAVSSPAACIKNEGSLFFSRHLRSTEVLACICGSLSSDFMRLNNV